MSREISSDSQSVSRRKLIQSGVAVGIATIGLSTSATAHDSEASITINDNGTEGGHVHVAGVTMPDGGFVSIHDRRRFDGKILPSIIGITDFLEPGSHDNVSVPLFTENATAPGPAEGQDEDGLTESQPLIAIPHRDKNDSGEFNEGDPAYEDGPKTLDAFPVVNDIATVTVKGDDEEAIDAAKEEEKDARDEFTKN